jgi:hypothetical protein
MSLAKYLSARDMKAFSMSVRCGKFYKGGRNALQLTAEHSESVELLKNLLQIDQSMAKEVDRNIPRSVLHFAWIFLYTCSINFM